MNDQVRIGANTVAELAEMSFGEALKALQCVETRPTSVDAIRSPGQVFKLPVTSITMLENVFQHRRDEGNEYESERHVKSLAFALKQKPLKERVLDPVLLIHVDNSWICVDGHHRLKAYETAGVSEVLATLFEGSVTDAVLAAGLGNSKTKLPMTKRDRMNAAWKITAAGMASKKQTVEASGVSDGTVAGMRRLKRALEERGIEPANFSYYEAREIERGGQPGERGFDWEAAQVERFENALCKTFGTNVHRNRSFMAEALENRFPSLIEEIIERNAFSYRAQIENMFKEEDELTF